MTTKRDLSSRNSPVIQGRYDSLKLISWWQQKKVANARVMVVGAGALGNEALKNLALVGIGQILIVDFDAVEAANLTRSVLFHADDIGKLKAQVAAERLKELNPDVRVTIICGDITTDVGLGVFRNMDVVLVGVDNFAARIFVNRACYKVGTPWINGGIQEMVGEFHVYIPGEGACYECNLPKEAYKEIKRRLSCLLPIEEVEQGRVPTTPTISSIIGALQVQEALKLIHGMKVTGGSGLIFNGVTNEYLPASFPQNERCLNHNPLKSVITIERGGSDIILGELLTMAEEKLGPGAVIRLDFDLVFGATCTCGYTSQILKRLDKLGSDELRCPSCHKLMQPEMTSTISRAKPWLLDKTLSQAQVPPFHIITASNKTSVVHFELDEDRGKVLNFI
ncbi:MAG: HesA/MoeB/ThiF family protein [Chloroflexi bacterium]|nr:HesA/MoeB/ThiF family protein [Chloroflexota bacterium]